MPPPPPNRDSFHRERGKLIDGFAHLETSLVRAIVRAKGTVKNDTLVGKLKTLRELRAGNLSSEAETAAARIAELIPVRADLVHGSMETLDRDGERYAVFTNARDAASDVQPARQMTLASMRRMIKELSDLSATLNMC